MPPYKTNHSSQSLLVKPIEKVIEDAKSSLILNISGRKLREYPKLCTALELVDTYEIDLSKNRLAEFPREVCDFVGAERIDCHGNSIRTIPHEIVRLKALTLLDLSCNLLTQLPLHLCALTLKVLNLSNNKLLSLPDEIGCLRTLVELDVSCNEIAYVPPQIGNLQNLRRFNLRKNSLVQLPLEMSHMKLVSLDLSHNKITRIPHEFRFINSLVHLSLAGNPLEYPPAKFCDAGLTQIKKLLEIEAGRRKASLPLPPLAATTIAPYNDSKSPYRGYAQNGYIEDRYKMALSLDATPPYSSQPECGGGKLVQSNAGTNGFFSSLWNGCRPIITSLKKGREGISQGATDSGYGTDICSSIPNIAFETDNNTPNILNDNTTPLAGIQYEPLHKFDTKLLIASSSHPSHNGPNGSQNVCVSTSTNTFGCSRDGESSLQGRKSSSTFDKWCSPLFTTAFNQCPVATSNPETVPDLSNFLNGFLASDSIAKYQNAGQERVSSKGSVVGVSSTTLSVPAATEITYAVPLSNTCEDEFTRELHRQKMHYETKRKMAEKLRSEMLASTTHDQTTTTLVNSSHTPALHTFSPTSDSSFTLSISNLMVTEKVSTCSNVSLQRRMANRSAPLARIESFIETNDSPSRFDHFKSKEETLSQRQFNYLHENQPENLTSSVCSDILPSFHSTLNNGKASPFKDPRINNLKRFNEPCNGASIKSSAVPCGNGSITKNGARDPKSSPDTSNPSKDSPVSRNSNSPLSNIRKLSSSASYKQTKLEREIELIREDRKIIMKLREIIETRLKVVMPEDLAGSLMDGVVLCHLVNHVKPHSISTIHVPSKSVPKLTLAKSKRNVENFIEACRKLGVTEANLCVEADILEGRNLNRLARTVSACLQHCASPGQRLLSNDRTTQNMGKLVASDESPSPPSPPALPISTTNNPTVAQLDPMGTNGKIEKYPGLNYVPPSKISAPITHTNNGNSNGTLRRSSNQHKYPTNTPANPHFNNNNGIVAIKDNQASRSRLDTKNGGVLWSSKKSESPLPSFRTKKIVSDKTYQNTSSSINNHINDSSNTPNRNYNGSFQTGNSHQRQIFPHNLATQK